MTNIELDHRIYFPNGKGYTPCSALYEQLRHELYAICDPNDGESIHDLSPDDYQRWSELDNELANLRLHGHVGTSVRY